MYRIDNNHALNAYNHDKGYKIVTKPHSTIIYIRVAQDDRKKDNEALHVINRFIRGYIIDGVRVKYDKHFIYIGTYILVVTIDIDPSILRYDVHDWVIRLAVLAVDRVLDDLVYETVYQLIEVRNTYVGGTILSEYNIKKAKQQQQKESESEECST